VGAAAFAPEVVTSRVGLELDRRLGPCRDEHREDESEHDRASREPAPFFTAVLARLPRRTPIIQAGSGREGSQVVGVGLALRGAVLGCGLAADLHGYALAVYPRGWSDRRLPVANYPQEYGDRSRGYAAHPREYADRLRRLAAHRQKSGDRLCVTVDRDVRRMGLADILMGKAGTPRERRRHRRALVRTRARPPPADGARPSASGTTVRPQPPVVSSAACTTRTRSRAR
jgi:hypothetical protein